MQLARERMRERRALSGVATLPVQLHHPRMTDARDAVRRRVHEVVSQGAQVRLDERADTGRRLVGHEAEVDRRGRRGGHAVGAGSTREPRDVERRSQDRESERQRAFRSAHAQLGAQPLVGRGDRQHRRAVLRRDRPNGFIEAGDGDPAIIGPHRREHSREFRRRIRRPVAVVPAVEGSGRTVHRHAEPHHAADAVHELQHARLVARPVGEDPEVGRQERAMRGEHLAEVARARLLLTLEEEFEVHGGGASRRLQCVERGEHPDDRPLVITRAACVEPPVVGAGPGGGRLLERPHAPAALHMPIAQLRRERARRDPVARDHGLPVIVRVEHHRPRRPGSPELAVDGGRAPGRLETARLDAAAREHRDEGVGRATDLHRVRRDVRQ